MSNKELENRILKVGMWIFTFFFWYLVIAFFLKSDYPIYNQPFNRKDAYEVLRDGLTLSAYFLAPAVACVLFNDWRSQHIEIKNEEVTQDIWKLVDRISVLLNFSGYALNSKDFNKNQYNIYQLIINLNTKKDLLRLSGSEIKAYHNNLNELTSLLRKLVENYVDATFANNRANDERVPEKHYKKTPELNQALQDVIKYSDEVNRIKKEITDISLKLKPLYVK
ncbi:hypothetical protein ACFODO_14490 [Acinetobacter sichuanensis]|uniref:Uncharacterized protein n=1 Tax=Acinetobacter sichuanensis TaxID=2136183 RepID=A0A371YJ08_9GAMM|nr:hypothetical protein [Acinetobacter sichuanensis]RFC81453.1 hypothetical protein C9E89_021760 [Acinetobacter sichuanensis]